MTRASCILFWFSLTLAVSLGLYQTSYRVDGLSHTLRSLNAQIEAEQRNIHVLKAEWVYLANPSRIESAARKHLDLEPTKTSQFSNLKKLYALLPARHEIKTREFVDATRPRPAAFTPQGVAEDSTRVNMKLVIGNRATSVQPEKTAYRLAGDDSYGIGSVGGAP